MGVTRQPAAEPPIQLLTPEGQRVDHPDFHYRGTTEDLQTSLRNMVLTRRLDTEATALQRQGELGLWPQLTGQEAAQVGSAAALGPHDRAFPGYREHGVAQTLGLDLVHLLALYRGVEMCDWDPAEHRLNPYSIVIGTHNLHAVGYAMGQTFDGMVGNTDDSGQVTAADNAATIVYYGDGANSQGDANEAYVFAASYDAPVVLFVQNNQWAISEPLSVQTRVPLYQRALGFGIPGVRVDGNDVLAVQAVTEQALARAYAGEGPTLIEADTYRMGPHTTADDPTRYRLADEVEAWRPRDPILRLTTYLKSAGVGDDFFSALDTEADDFAADLRRRCLELPDPQLADWFAHTYVEQTDDLAEQAENFRQYVDSFIEERH